MNFFKFDTTDSVNSLIWYYSNSVLSLLYNECNVYETWLETCFLLSSLLKDRVKTWKNTIWIKWISTLALLWPCNSSCCCKAKTVPVIQAEIFCIKCKSHPRTKNINHHRIYEQYPKLSCKTTLKIKRARVHHTL